MRPIRLLVLTLPTAAALTLPGTAAGAAAVPEPAGPQPAGQQPAVALALAAPGAAIRGSYLVTLETGLDARSVARAAGVAPRFVYGAAVHGFAAALTPAQLDRVRRTPGVVAVEEDAVVRADGTQTSPTYGLDRIDQRTLPLSASYTYRANGAGVRAYVVDTGIATAHRDFGGRASNVYDALGGDGQDCNGHGTHVAGTVGSSTYGVAKGALLRGVRVLGCDGSGSTSGIVAALDWVRTNGIRPAVANLSLGGGYSAALNAATTGLADSGIFVAVAAGNEGQDACAVSPASAAGVFTTAASDRADTHASFSNHGACVEGYAPGVSITSTWLGGRTTTISGTSMASPHVAGVAALYKSAAGDAASATVSSWLVGGATTGAVRGNPPGTPNRLLYTNGL